MSAAEDRLRRSLVTPEGLALRLRLGTAGERAAAFLIDVVIIAATLVVLTIAAVTMAIRLKTISVAGLIWLGGFFVLRNLYFAAFELGPRGATPGKRALGLRVVPQRGGRLTADAVLARNLTREIELFLPLTLYLWSGASSGGLLLVAGLAWTGIFALFPLFNRDRMRVGDLMAGTWVAHVPRRVLLPDLAAANADSTLTFTRAQLDAYGVRELQTLEHVLRSRDIDTLAAVAERIQRRIDWSEGGGDTLSFLEAFYAALRKHLEHRLLLGHRRLDKFDRA